MKKIFQIIAVLAVVASIVVWLLYGAHVGWTTTQTPVIQVDEITGIEYTTYIDKLTLGIELPVIGITAGVVLWVISLFIKKSTRKSS
jgi:NADH:ubiquinone oxidoreductase subunit 5 (subunit L)/multisubunit Na+/H+ antiporter MnhA subunit